MQEYSVWHCNNISKEYNCAFCWLSVVSELSIMHGVHNIQMTKVKVKVKADCGSYSTAALRHIVLLPE